MRAENQALWDSYARSLRAANRSEKTITSYHLAWRELDAFLGAEISQSQKDDIRRYLGARLSEISPVTVGIRFRSLRAQFRWMVAEDIITRSPMDGLRQPAVRDVPPAVLDDEQLRRLLKACEGKEFEDRRDTAIVRLMLEPGGIRLGEVTGMHVTDLLMDASLFSVTGKGNKTRWLGFGAKTGQALDRYLRMRAAHRRKRLPGLWLGTRGVLSSSGIAQLIGRRGVQALGIHVHPHQLRHSSADAWFRNGGSEGDAMQLWGWSSDLMPKRYGRSAAADRARQAARKAALGDRL
jgi:site-specific recombinase XerC